MTENMKRALSKMLGTQINHAQYKTKQLHGGTLGDVVLSEGRAEAAGGRVIPFKIVSKTQKKWERHGDPDSWRREFDLYSSSFGSFFSDTFRWPVCYLAKMNDEENEWQIWMEHIDGTTGLDLTGDMYELAALKLGQFQGRLYAEQPPTLKNLPNLGRVEYAKNFYLHYRSWNEVYDYIRMDDCDIPKHLCRMLIAIDENEADVWSRIEKLPVILCHRDFWVTNIFHTDDRIVLIDWDTAGFGYLGEDIASLIADEADVGNMVTYCQRCIAAYYRGFTEYVDLSHITDNCIYELILVMFGYRLVEWYKFAESPESRAQHLDTLQKVYEIGLRRR